MDAFQTIRTQVTREASRLTSSEDLGHTEQDLLALLADKNNRDAVLDVCLRILQEDPESRRAMGLFLLYYLPGLPFFRTPLEQMLARATELCEEPSGYQRVFEELKAAIEALLPHRTSAGVIKGGIGSLRTSPMPSQGPLPQDSSSFRVSSNNVSRSRQKKDAAALAESFVSVVLISDEDVIHLAHRRNRNFALQRKDTPFYLAPVSDPSKEGGGRQWDDYIHQCPLVCSEQHVEKYIRILSQLWDRYRTHPNVLLASSFLFKQICDGYVSKITFGPPYTSFRTISMCFLPTLLQWMEADYLCIRLHVYDFLMTLGMHLQLLDSQNVYPGVTQELQRELVWLVLNVLQRQILVIPYDEMTWTAVAKCILAVLPRAERSWIDGRVFVQILNITGLAEQHPDTYGCFVEALVQSLLLRPGERGSAKDAMDLGKSALSGRRSGDGGTAGDAMGCPGSPARQERENGNTKNTKFNVPPHSYIFTLPNAVDEREFSKLGKCAFTEILSLYRRAYTVGGRLWLFKLVFVLAVERLRAAESLNEVADEDGVLHNNPVLEAAISESFECLVAYGFFWYYHLVLLFSAPHIRQEVMRTFSMSAGLHTEYTQSTHVKLLDIFMDMAEQDAALPDEITDRLAQYFDHHPLSSAIPNATDTSLADPIEVEEAVIDGMHTARLLLKVDTTVSGVAGGGSYNTAWRLLHYCLEAIRALGTETETGQRLLQRFIDLFVNCVEDTDYVDSGRIRRLLPDLIASLCIQWRTSSSATAASTGGEVLGAIPSPNLGDAVLGDIVEAYLFKSIRPVSHRLLALYYHVFELLAEFEGTLFHPDVPESTDLSFLLMDSVAVIPMSAVQSLGVRLLWALYKGLAGEMPLSACRARQVLVSMLSQFPGMNPSSFGYVWKCIMEDGYPPVSLIGAAVVMEKWKLLKSDGDTAFAEFACIWQSLHAVAKTLLQESPEEKRPAR